MPIRVVRLDSLEQFAAVNLTSDPGYDPDIRTIPSCAEVRINWSLTDGKTAHNVLHCSYNGTPAFTTAVAQTVFAAISTGAQWTALAGFLAPTCSLSSVTITDIRSNVGLAFNSTGSAVPGTSAGTAMPDEVALVTRLNTNTRGKSGRGRAYQPGWASNALGTAGVVAPGAVTALTNWYTVAVNSAIGLNIGAVVIGLHSRKAYTSPITGKNFPARAPTTLPVTGYTVDNHWDTQRPRGLK